MRHVRYKEVDYDQLRALAQEKRLAANASLIKVKKLQKLNRDGKEAGVLAQHRKVWLADMLRLDRLHARLGSASASALDRAAMDSSGEGYDAEVLDVIDCAARLEAELEAFKRDTVEPVLMLRQDLQYWLRETANRSDGTASRKPGSDLGDPQQILPVIASVKQQQQVIIQRLDEEAAVLWQELQTDPANAEVSSSGAGLSASQLAKGIPSEAYDLDCPDDELKASLLQQFLLLDHKYCERLALLEECFKGTADCSSGPMEAGGGDRTSTRRSGSGASATADDSQTPPPWDAEDDFVLGALLDAYSCDAVVAQHRRHLVTDRLTRQWPLSDKADLANRETRVLASRSLQQQRKVVARDWIRSRAELLTKVRATCLDLCAAQELQSAQHERLQKQHEICRILFEKVHAWREQKMEAMTLEQEMLRERVAAEQLAVRAQQEKETAKRTAEKAKVEAYRQQLEEERQEREVQAAQRLAALKESLAQQATYDRERVVFREAELLKRQAEKQKILEAEAAEEEDRERRLEALRETVRVNVERDPLRLLHDTESWQHKLHPHEDEPVSIQRPLFDIHTFTDKQITADPRVRLEQRLRDAGLHTTDYARQVLSQTHGPQAPRRDAASTFKLE